MMTSEMGGPRPAEAWEARPAIGPEIESRGPYSVREGPPGRERPVSAGLPSYWAALRLFREREEIRENNGGGDVSIVLCGDDGSPILRLEAFGPDGKERTP